MVLSPYVDTQDDGRHARLLLDGTSVALGERAVTSFALILHELATNAAKYGALSVPGGSIHIGWSLIGDNLAMKWEERGGPPLAGTPKSSGFGTVLSNQSVRGQFGGKLFYQWNPNGLVVDLSIPMERLTG
jgi:two-component sensor histidine kinase